MGDLTVEKLYSGNYISIHRNKLLTETFYLTGDIEKYGSGYWRIRKHIQKYPTMKFEFKEISGGFFTRLKYIKQKISIHNNVPVNDTVNDTVNGTVNDTVNDRQYNLINLIKENGSITINDLSAKLNITRSTVIRDLKKLRELNIIQRIGSDKTGYWVVKNKK